MTVAVPRLYIEVPADDFADGDVIIASMFVEVPADDMGPSIVETLYPATNLYPSDDLYPTGPPT